MVLGLYYIDFIDYHGIDHSPSVHVASYVLYTIDSFVQGFQPFMKTKFSEFSLVISLRIFQISIRNINKVVGKSRGGSSTAKCYCLD